jgi:hypothetical protein
MKPKGILRVADTLLTQYGQHFDKIASLSEHTQGSSVWAHNLVNLHDSDDHPDDPVDCRLWEPVEVDALEAGLTAAGVPIHQSKYALKDNDPNKWRHYLLHLWRRHQHKPGVQQIYQRKLRLAKHMLTKFFADYPDQHCPVTFDNWYTQPAFCQFLDKTIHAAYVGT